MSNLLAIGAITEQLRDRLQQLIDEQSSGIAAGVQMRTDNPKQFDDLNAVNLFLYQATPNTSGAWLDAATRDDQGKLHSRPYLALDLDYIVTFLGNDQLQAQRLLGLVMLGLHRSPVISIDEPVDITSAETKSREAKSVKQRTPIRVTIVSLGREDLHRLWAMFPQVPYRLSLLLRVSPVILESPSPPPGKQHPDKVLIVATSHLNLTAADRTQLKAPGKSVPDQNDSSKTEAT